MSRKQWALLAAIFIAAAFIAWLARSSRQAPLLPTDDTHAAFESAAACLDCHSDSAAVPRSPRHPLGDDCLRCHGAR
jgi:cytochrome c553